MLHKSVKEYLQSVCRGYKASISKSDLGNFKHYKNPLFTFSYNNCNPHFQILSGGHPATNLYQKCEIQPSFGTWSTSDKLEFTNYPYLPATWLFMIQRFHLPQLKLRPLNNSECNQIHQKIGNPFANEGEVDDIPDQVLEDVLEHIHQETTREYFLHITIEKESFDSFRKGFTEDRILNDNLIKWRTYSGKYIMVSSLDIFNHRKFYFETYDDIPQCQHWNEYSFSVQNSVNGIQDIIIYSNHKETEITFENLVILSEFLKREFGADIRKITSNFNQTANRIKLD